MAAFFEPSAEAVLAAVRSLYADEIRPMGRILLRRLREQAAAAAGAGCDAATADPESVGLIEPKYLRALCDTCQGLVVAPAGGKEYAVELAGAPGAFVDPCSAQDPYPGQLWAAFAQYIQDLDEEEGSFPSGRYAAAQILAARSLAFFRGRSLGELCHIVQLAVGHRQLLGHANGKMVPYSRSEACLRLRCAVRQQPLAESGERRCATWAELGHCLYAVLAASSTPFPGAVSVSNMKTLFRSDLGLELSETALGYARIGDLLQDARLNQLCAVHTLANGQSVVCLRQVLPPCFGLPPAAAAPRPRPQGASTCASQRFPAPRQPQAPAMLLAFAPPAPCGPLLAVAPTLPLAAPRGRAGSDGGDSASEMPASAAGSAGCVLSRFLEKESPAASTYASSAAGSDTASESGDSSVAAPLDLESYGFVVKNGFLDEAPKRRHVRSRSL